MPLSQLPSLNAVTTPPGVPVPIPGEVNQVSLSIIGLAEKM